MELSQGITSPTTTSSTVELSQGITSPTTTSSTVELSPVGMRVTVVSKTTILVVSAVETALLLVYMEFVDALMITDVDVIQMVVPLHQ